MASRLLSAAVLARAAYGANRTAPQLGPVSGGSSSSGGAPSTSLSLNYGFGNSSLVHVGLAMNYPSVLLEEIPAITAVDCTPSSVAVTFNSTTALSAAASAWTADGSTIVLVTNHLGDCDAELERGFFLANSFATDAAGLVITADVEKSDIAGTAASTVITFSNVPATTTTKREIVLNHSIPISGSISLPAPVTLFSDTSVQIEVESADASADVTISGYLEYKILDATLEAFYIDVDADLSASLELRADLEASFSGNYSYSPAALTFGGIDVPGILTLGPALVFSVGVELDADIAVNATGTVGASIPDGQVRIDFVDSASSYAKGWTPQFTGKLDITEKATIDVNPFAALTLEIAFDLLDGVVNLAAGITAEPRFDDQFVITAGQTVGSGVTGVTGSGTCADGVQVTSAFDFSVYAFVTDVWSDTLYSATVPIANECYTF